MIFALGVGCRATEALSVDWSAVDLEERRAVLQITKRSNGAVAQYVELPPVVVQALSSLPHREGAVFRTRLPGVKTNGEPIPLGERFRDVESGGGQFKSGWAGACARAGLPGKWTVYPSGGRRYVPEVTPHDTRHIWASWHYEVHRDLLRLRDEGGWGTARMVE
ncbi:tyrosine-type recombinase/integrase [Sediminicoccus sp. KRV36]|nr:tyrosine-type recombinase/integrase [Sediminicoccus rosea]